MALGMTSHSAQQPGQASTHGGQRAGRPGVPDLVERLGPTRLPTRSVLNWQTGTRPSGREAQVAAEGHTARPPMRDRFAAEPGQETAQVIALPRRQRVAQAQAAVKRLPRSPRRRPRGDRDARGNWSPASDPPPSCRALQAVHGGIGIGQHGLHIHVEGRSSLPGEHGRAATRRNDRVIDAHPDAAAGAQFGQPADGLVGDRKRDVGPAIRVMFRHRPSTETMNRSRSGRGNLAKAAASPGRSRSW